MCFNLFPFSSHPSSLQSMRRAEQVRIRQLNKEQNDRNRQNPRERRSRTQTTPIIPTQRPIMTTIVDVTMMVNQEACVVADSDYHRLATSTTANARNSRQSQQKYQNNIQPKRRRRRYRRTATIKQAGAGIHTMSP